MTIIALPEHRRRIILERLAVDQRVVARDLATEFGVSEDAIRRDLRDLASAGKCRKVYGGAISAGEVTPFVERVDRDFHLKRSLARTGAAMIGSGDTVYIDAGTTNLLLAESLRRDQPVTVITNSVAIAAAVYRRPEVRLFLIGGHVDPDIDGSVGSIAQAQIDRYRPDMTFIGVCAVCPEHGVSATDDRDAELKRSAVASSKRVVLLATNDKLSRTAPHHVATTEQIDTVVVESDAPADDCARLSATGVQVVRANASADPMPRAV